MAPLFHLRWQSRGAVQTPHYGVAATFKKNVFLGAVLVRLGEAKHRDSSLLSAVSPFLISVHHLPPENQIVLTGNLSKLPPHTACLAIYPR
jgi:hypothetical protein